MPSFPQVLFAFAMFCLALAVDYCPPLGPVYEVPQNLSTVATIRQAAQNLTAVIDRRVEHVNDRPPTTFLNVNAPFQSTSSRLMIMSLSFSITSRPHA